MSEHSVLLIPGTPLLLTGVDPREPPQMQELRSVIHSALAVEHTWTVRVPGRIVPPVLSLGSHGIVVGTRVHVAEPAIERGSRPVTGVAEPSDVLRGDALDAAVRTMKACGMEAVQSALDVPTGVLVAVLTALEAGVRVRLVTDGSRGSAIPSDESAPLLVPFDFSGAAHPDAPLAPRVGAMDFDDRLEAALSSSVDQDLVAELQTHAHGLAAWIDEISALDLTCTRSVKLAAADVHHVRYRVFALERLTVAKPPGRGRPRDHEVMKCP